MSGQPITPKYLLGNIEKLIAGGADPDTVTAQVLNYAVHDIFSSDETESGYYIERVLSDSDSRYVKAALIAFFLRILWLAKAKEFKETDDFDTLRDKVLEGANIYTEYEGNVDVDHYDSPRRTLEALVPNEIFERLLTHSQKLIVSDIINSLNSTSMHDYAHEYSPEYFDWA